MEGADTLVIGGYAVAFHGHPRATEDLDLLVRATPANAALVHLALTRFGAPLVSLGVTPTDFATPGRVVQIGLPPLRIDVLNTLAGVTFDEATADAPTFGLDGHSIRVIGLAALLQNKRRAGRLQDLADVAALERLHRPS